MSADVKYELAVAECNTLRVQLKEAYEKCSAIYETLSILDEHATNERTTLQSSISDLKRLLNDEVEKNRRLSMEKLRSETNEKYLQQKLNSRTQEFNQVMISYRKLYIQQQQEKFIHDHLIVRLKK